MNILSLFDKYFAVHKLCLRLSLGFLRQILCLLEKLCDFLVVLWNSTELINQLSFVNHESFWNMLDFEHLGYLWKFVDVHVHIIN